MGGLTFSYAHVPVMHNEQGQKLSKQTKAAPVEVQNASQVLLKVFEHLHLTESSQVVLEDTEAMLEMAQAEWRARWKKEEWG